MKFSRALVLLALAPFAVPPGAASAAAEPMTVTVANDAAKMARPAETIVVPWAEIFSRLPDALIDHLAVKHNGQIIPAQVTNFDPDNKKGHSDELLFQHDFTAGETQATFTIEKTDLPVPPFPTKTFARYVPERLDDFAWENDRVGHRIYGPAIALPSAGREQLTTSGIDVWCKHVRYMIVDRWYLKSHDNYHKDTGEGLDMYDVGKSRGAGGLGIWDGSKLHVSGNWKTWKILANGPVRTIFETTYDTWDAGGFPIKETKRFTVDAGHNLDQMDSTFEFQPPAGGNGEITVALGLAKHKKASAAQLSKDDAKRTWLSLWENYPGDGQLGTAVLIPDGFSGFAEDDLNHLALTKAKSGQPLRYYVGAGWERSGDFSDQKSWEAYLTDLAARLDSPLKLSYAPTVAASRKAVMVDDEAPLMAVANAAPAPTAEPASEPTPTTNAPAASPAVAPHELDDSPKPKRVMLGAPKPPAPGAADASTNAVEFSNAAPLEWSKRMADSQMAREGDTLFYHGDPATRNPWNYTSGLFASALLRLSDETGDKKYADFAEKLIGTFIQPNGDIATYKYELYSVDNIPPARAALTLLKRTNDERYKKAVQRVRAQLADHPRTHSGGFWHKLRYPHQMWLDGLYMAEPFYAQYAVDFNEPKIFDDVATQFIQMASHSYDPKTHLFYHVWDESKNAFWANPETGTSANFWGRADGWFAMAFADVLAIFPKDHPKRAELVQWFEKFADGIVNYQDPATGLWWQVLDQGARQDNYLEGSASSMFVYALAKGINDGNLSREKYAAAAQRGYAGLIRDLVKTDEKAQVSLTQVCQVAGLDAKPAGRVKRDGSFEYYTKGEKIVSNDLKGVGPLITAGMEMDRLSKGGAVAQN